MPLSDANFLHENTGTTSLVTSHVVSLAGTDTTTAGSTVVVAGRFPQGTPSGIPAGFVLAKNQGATAYVYYKPDVAAGESSWTFTTSTATSIIWYVAEISGVDLVDVVDVTGGATSVVNNGGTASTGTTLVDAGLSTVALAAFSVTPASSWSGYTNGFQEVAAVGGGGSQTLGVARLFETSTTRTFECTATLTTASSGLSADAVMVVFRAADSPVVAPLAMLAGFEWGTVGGIGSHNGDTNMLGAALALPQGTFGTSYLIQSGSARNSSYGLRVVQSAAITYVRSGNLNASSGCFGLNVRVVSATGQVTVLEVLNGSLGTTARFLYDTSTSKFGVRVGTAGTISWQSGTTAINTWVWIDLRARVNSSSQQVEWRIETAANTYTDQTPATATGQSITNFYGVQFGFNGAQTMTADFDDVVMSRYYSAYPLGPHEIRLLTVDPAGTPSVSGTTTNFSTFASNGTLTAWNATTARNNLDEVPVTVSAAADGVVQTTTAASDYMQFPMSTYTCTATEFINGVRMMAPLWSGTGAGAGDLAIRGHDGTTETALATASQITPGSPTAISASAPVWRCAMWQATNGWSQTELDAAALRVGFSGDATPDMGVSAVYLEVAVGRTKTQQVFGSSVSAEVDPTRLGVVSVTTTAPDSGDVSLYYEKAGSPTTVPVTAGSTVSSQVNAEMAPDTNYLAAYFPPEGVPDA